MNSTPQPPTRRCAGSLLALQGALGRELLGVALEAGDSVIATLRHPGALRDLADTYPDRLDPRPLDVTDQAGVATTISQVLATYKRIDVVVNNAGYSVVGATEEMTDAQIDHQLAILLRAPIQITRAFLAPMRQEGGGRIIQISSVGGQLDRFNLYCHRSWPPCNSAVHDAQRRSPN